MMQNKWNFTFFNIFIILLSYLRPDTSFNKSIFNGNDFSKTKLFLVSKETKILFFFAYFIFDLILSHSTLLFNCIEFGRVDSPPISIISAPSF